MRVIDAVKETIADVSSVNPVVRANGKDLTLETSAIVSFTASIPSSTLNSYTSMVLDVDQCRMKDYVEA